MKSFLEQAHVYSAYHQNQKTLIAHLVSMPLIFFSSMIFLGFILLKMPGVFSISFAAIGTIALCAYYIRLHWRLGLCLTPILLILLWISGLLSHGGPSSFSFWTFIVLFIAGWAVQFYGHTLDGKKPTLMENACQALDAPLFLMAEVCFKLGFMKDLQDELHGKEDSAA